MPIPDSEFHAKQLEEIRRAVTVVYGGESKAALNFSLGKMVSHAIAIGVAMGSREQAERDRQASAAREDLREASAAVRSTTNEIEEAKSFPESAGPMPIGATNEGRTQTAPDPEQWKEGR